MRRVAAAAARSKGRALWSQFSRSLTRGLLRSDSEYIRLRKSSQSSRNVSDEIALLYHLVVFDDFLFLCLLEDIPLVTLYAILLPAVFRLVVCLVYGRF